MTDENKCMKCDGCGKVANTDDQEPWSQWANLPLQSATAVVAGLVKPIECPECCGSGNRPGTDAERLIDMIIEAKLIVPECAEDPTHGCVVVWSANAMEQIEAFMDEVKG